MAAGLDFLNRVSVRLHRAAAQPARAEMALEAFPRPAAPGGRRRQDEAGRRGHARSGFRRWSIRHGLVAYWPGSNGYVSLTAWAVQFMVEAKGAGFRVDDKLMATLTRSLEQSLRSDYGHFIDGEAFAERCWALAALAAAGKFDPAYAAELARKAQFLDLEGVAEVLQSFAKAGDTTSPVDRRPGRARSGTASSSASTRARRSTADCRRRLRRATASSCRPRPAPWPR